MSMPFDVKITCPKCGKEIEITMWKTLNADVSPAVAAKLLAGEMFYETCPECGFVSKVAYPMLYHDMTNKALVYLAWKDEELGDAKAMLDQFHDTLKAAGYRYRIVRNDRELIEKAMIFKAGLDDRVIEIIKDIQRSGYESKFNMKAPDIYFLINQEDPEEWCFLTMNNPPLSQHITRDLYERGVNDFLPFCDSSYEGCLCVNMDWVTEFLDTNKGFGKN